MLKRYPECSKLCVVKTLKRYLKQTKNIRQDDQLLIAYIKPHRAISRDTLARWTLIILQKAGINTQKYKGHSTRGAFTFNHVIDWKCIKLVACMSLMYQICLISLSFLYKPIHVEVNFMCKYRQQLAMSLIGNVLNLWLVCHLSIGSV